MQKDAHKVIQKCDKCQRFRNVKMSPKWTNDDHFLTMVILPMGNWHWRPITTRKETSQISSCCLWLFYQMGWSI